MPQSWNLSDMQCVPKKDYRLKSRASAACSNLNALTPNEPKNTLNVIAENFYACIAN